MGERGSRPPPRRLKQRVRSARGRRGSSTRWLERQLNDPYVARARAENRRSRAAYKLLELDKRYGLLRAGMRVADLGAAPGGWSQVAAEIVGSRPDDPLVLAVDVTEMDPIAGVRFLQHDITGPDASAAIIDALAGCKADIVLSDMAAPATGHRGTDHLRIVALVEAAAQLAFEILAPGGAFVAKVLQGGTEGQLLARLKTDFAKVVHAKPPASRSGSAETYLVATGFRG